MDANSAVIVVLLIIILTFYLYVRKPAEGLDVGPTNNSYIRLYEDFEFKNLKWEFQPHIKYDEPPQSYIKQIVKINLKSFDINLLAYGLPKYDQLRRVEIWSIYDGSNTASSESDFYSSYIEPEYALRANAAKFELIAKVLPGQRFKLNVEIPVKKVLVFAWM